MTELPDFCTIDDVQLRTKMAGAPDACLWCIEVFDGDRQEWLPICWTAGWPLLSLDEQADVEIVPTKICREV